MKIVSHFLSKNIFQIFYSLNIKTYLRVRKQLRFNRFYSKNMTDLTRRSFVETVAKTSLAAAVVGTFPSIAYGGIVDDKLAVLGGTPVRNKAWLSWPAAIADDKMLSSITETVKSGKWSRIQDAVHGKVATFEKEYAALIGAKFCVGTGSGTQALSTCVEALGIGPGDEVITSPYTDFGTISAIIGSRALAVMADLDPASYQLDPASVEKLVNKNTKGYYAGTYDGHACRYGCNYGNCKKAQLIRN
jgi:perosamine synthetase